MTGRDLSRLRLVVSVLVIATNVAWLGYCMGRRDAQHGVEIDVEEVRDGEDS